MLVIIGFIIVTAAVLGGFAWAGGHVGALIHPSEIVIIGGAALGALVVMSSKKMLIDLAKGCFQAVKGTPFNKKAHEELFKLMYDIFRTARREGMLAIEPHLSNPHESSIFHKYPLISKNHHVTEFICGSLMPVLDGSVKPEKLPELLDLEIKAMEEEHHGPLAVLQKTADGLPGFGIVAAVLGIVITMGHIDGPVHEIGHKVGAALVGTFLGILASYGFLAPLAAKLEHLNHIETAFFRTISNLTLGYVSQIPPKAVIEQARRSLAREVKPSREQMEEVLKALDAA